MASTKVASHKTSEAGAPEIGPGVVTPQMIQAAFLAMRPYRWEDGQIGLADESRAMEAALRAALRVQLESSRPTPTGDH